MSDDSSDEPLSSLAKNSAKSTEIANSDSSSDDVNLAALAKNKQKVKKTVRKPKRKKTPSSSGSDSDPQPSTAKSVNPSLKISHQPRKQEVIMKKKPKAKVQKIVESSSDCPSPVKSPLRSMKTAGIPDSPGFQVAEPETEEKPKKSVKKKLSKSDSSDNDEHSESSNSEKPNNATKKRVLKKKGSNKTRSNDNGPLEDNENDDVEEKKEDFAKESSSDGDQSKTGDVAKESTANGDDDGDTTDTSIEDKDKPSAPKKEKSRKTGKDVKEIKKEKVSQKDEEHPRIRKLKRYISTAGLRCVYKQLFTDCPTNKKKIAKLEEFLAEKGLKGNLTLDMCKSYKERKAQEKELAELDTSNIIASSEGRILRSQAPRKRGGRVMTWSSDEKSDDDDEEGNKDDSDSTAEQARRGCKEMLSRLKGIVDSGGSDSD